MIPAADLLRLVLKEADVIAEDEDGTAYLLLPLPRGVFDALCEFGGDGEELEDSWDREVVRDDDEYDHRLAPMPTGPDFPAERDLPIIVVDRNGRAKMPDGSTVQWRPAD